MVKSTLTSLARMMTMTTTEKTFQVPLTFKDNSTDLDKAAAATRDIEPPISAQDATPEDTPITPSEATVEANQALAMADFELESTMSVIEDDTQVIEDLEMQNLATESSETVLPAVGFSLPAALCDEELLKELSQIPDKMGFKIGDVADLLGIKAYVLRYWETEFDMLKPKKAANNQRYYTKKNVENAFLIRKLLHRDRFSIEGARSALKELKTVVKKEKDWSQVNQKVNTLEERLDHFLVDLKQLKNLFIS